MQDNQLKMPRCHRVKGISTMLTTGTDLVQIKTYVWI